MDSLDTREILASARIEIEGGDCQTAYRLLLSLIEQKNPEALFLFSMFQLKDMESVQEFEKRSFDLLLEASGLGHPEALYTLGTYYDSGDGVDMDNVKASSLFKQAAEKGHSRAKYSYGLDLFYGSNGMLKNEMLGLAFIKEAADSGVEYADEMLKKLT